jgi:hypothetical protein
MRRGSDSFWGSLVDEIRVWKAARSPSQIVASLRLTCPDLLASASASANITLCLSFTDVVLNSSREGPSFNDAGPVPRTYAAAVLGDKFEPWCVAAGDKGFLRNRWVQTQLGQAWGGCTSKARLPGVGFDYDPDALRAHLSHESTLSALSALSACGYVPLIVTGNVARR